MSNECCYPKDTGYHVKHPNYTCTNNMNGATLRYSQELYHAFPSVSETSWESSEYFSPGAETYNPTPSTVYSRSFADNTPPREILQTLLEQKDRAHYFPNLNNMAVSTPPSPTSTQFVTSIDTISSPIFDGFSSSINSHNVALYYMVDPSATENAYHQNHKHLRHQKQQQQQQQQLHYQHYQHQQQQNQHQNQYQYQSQQQNQHCQNNSGYQSQHQHQAQYKFMQQKYILNNMASSSQNTPNNHQHHHYQYYQQQRQQQQQLRTNQRSYKHHKLTQNVTPHQHSNSSTAVPVSLKLYNEQLQPKRKRNTSRRTSLSQLICPTCNRKFTRPYNLKSHQRTHTNERPFKCLRTGCSWAFARPHDLKRHDLLHSGIKNFMCSCGKPFARSDAFKRHQAVDKVCSLRLKRNYI